MDGSPSLQRRRGGTVRGAPERPHRHVTLVTQGCHASVAAIWSHKDDPHTLDYCDPTHLDSMHKVTLEVKGQTQIVNLSEKIKAGGIAHKLWIEQPENIPTCLATKPYPKSIVSPFFKKLKLCK